MSGPLRAFTSAAVAVALVLVLSARAASAAVVKYTYEGTVTSATGIFAGKGSTVSGSFTFDTGLSDSLLNTLPNTARDVFRNDTPTENRALAYTFYATLDIGDVHVDRPATRPDVYGAEISVFNNQPCGVSPCDSVAYELVHVDPKDASFSLRAADRGVADGVPDGLLDSTITGVRKVLDALDLSRFSESASGRWQQFDALGNAVGQVDFTWTRVAHVSTVSDTSKLDPGFAWAGILQIDDIYGGSTFHEPDFYTVFFRHVGVQPDGRMIVAGRVGTEIVVFRVDQQGTIDRTFGNGGDSRFTGGTPDDMIIDRDGSILLAGNASNGKLFVARLAADGGLDSSFGSGGVVTEDLGVIDEHSRLALQHDRRIVVVADSCCAQGEHVPKQTVVFRFRPDGSRDPDFSGGRVTLPVQIHADALALDGRGNIVIAGSARGDDADVIVLRLLSDGRLDQTFGQNGIASVRMSDREDAPSDAVVDGEGRIYVFAQSHTNAIYFYPANGSGVIRLHADGTLDESFGTRGIFPINLVDYPPDPVLGTLGAVSAGTLELLPDGRVLVAGLSGHTSDHAFDFSRLFAFALRDDGTRDPGFDVRLNHKGYVTPLLGAGLYSPWRSGLAVHPSGRVAMINSGCFCLVSILAPAWDLVPASLSFAPRTGVLPATVQTSALETVSGLGDSIEVPFQVAGGEWSLGGSASYSTLPGRLRNGTQLSVRHISASPSGTAMTTSLSAGGIHPKNNEALILGATTTSLFSSTTNSPPVFPTPSATASIAENSPAGSAVANVQAVDPDGDPLSCSIGGSGAVLFSIERGVVTTFAPLDHETQPAVAMSIACSDGKGGTAAQSLNITVTDVPEAPVLSVGPGPFVVPENASVGTAVATVGAADPEGDPITFRFASGNEAGRFAIDGSGRITVAAPLDFETTAAYALKVEADDGRAAGVARTVNITVSDVVEPPATVPAPPPAEPPATPPATAPATPPAEPPATPPAAAKTGGGGGASDARLLTLLLIALIAERLARAFAVRGAPVRTASSNSARGALR